MACCKFVVVFPLVESWLRHEGIAQDWAQFFMDRTGLGGAAGAILTSP